MHIISVTNIGIIHANLLKDQFQKMLYMYSVNNLFLLFYITEKIKWATYTSISTY